MTTDRLQTFLINLDGSDARLRAAAAALRDAGIDYQRFAAVDGRGRPMSRFAGYDERRAVAFYGRPMTGGEMGCYLSHLGCARAFLDSGAKYGLVLEDDVALAPDAAACLGALLDVLDDRPADWDLANLGRAPRRFMTPIAALPGNRTLVRAHYFPVTTTAILWSRAGAERFVATADHIFAPVDHFFRRWLSLSGRGLAVVPAPFRPSGAESELDREGSAGPARRRLPKTAGYFYREFRRQSANYIGALWHMGRYRLSGR